MLPQNPALAIQGADEGELPLISKQPPELSNVNSIAVAKENFQGPLTDHSSKNKEQAFSTAVQASVKAPTNDEVKSALLEQPSVQESLQQAPQSQQIERQTENNVKNELEGELELALQAVSPNDSMAPAAVAIAPDPGNEQEKPVFSMAPSNGNKPQLSLLREQARIALSRDDELAAIKALQVIRAEYPEDKRAPKQLASLLFKRQSFSDAVTVLDGALKNTPADSTLRVMRARISFQTGDVVNAYTVLAEHPFPKMADIELLSFRAALAERLERYENAGDDYRLLLAKEPQNAKWWLGLGLSQDKLSQVADAISSYKQARSLNQLPSQVSGFLQERIDILARQS
jgi:MSHA biogenesis protein MshN